MNSHRHVLPIAVLSAILSLAASCGGSSGSGDSRGGAINYTPTTANDGWQVATPAGQGVDEAVLNTAYQEANRLPNLFSLLVVKNGYLIAEGYFTMQALRVPPSKLVALDSRNGVVPAWLP